MQLAHAHNYKSSTTHFLALHLLTPPSSSHIIFDVKTQQHVHFGVLDCPSLPTCNESAKLPHLHDTTKPIMHLCLCCLFVTQTHLIFFQRSICFQIAPLRFEILYRFHPKRYCCNKHN